jgi:hypothetical protein
VPRSGTRSAPKLYELLLPYRDVAILTPNCAVAPEPTIWGCWPEPCLTGTAPRPISNVACHERAIEGLAAARDTRFEYALMLLARNRKGDSVLASELRSMAIATAERIGMRGLLHRNARLSVSK